MLTGPKVLFPLQTLVWILKPDANIKGLVVEVMFVPLVEVAHESHQVPLLYHVLSMDYIKGWPEDFNSTLP